MELLTRFSEPIILISSIIIALTTVIGAYEKWWLKPRERRLEKQREEEKQETLEMVLQIVEPLKEFISSVNEENKHLNNFAKEHKEELDEFRKDLNLVNGRVERVEQTVGITTYISYKEAY